MLVLQTKLVPHTEQSNYTNILFELYAYLTQNIVLITKN